jgi:hypothetical protein
MTDRQRAPIVTSMLDRLRPGPDGVSPAAAKERSMKDNDSNALLIAADDRVTCDFSRTALPPADKTAALTRVRYLERQLFDDSGQVRRGVTPDRADDTVADINHLRRALGWLEIDPDGRWRWPVTSDRSDAMAAHPSSQRGGRRRRLSDQSRESRR